MATDRSTAAARRLLGDNRRMMLKLGVVALAMFGFGWALIPLYKHICEIGRAHV